eukprot:CAMPEP_0170596290 /NCGR_PEP_ID=MMETSP0224-20130122/15029_1 /TAXON_ID=285029 /ORGANISM="Togula jolla, Strain CCCM 725" /LENGTH=476 /DNA_ID=CAMNT_0010920553 /DNA_START=78 /DNA_END=1508 /DNA_ORIENTATION=+
MTSFDLPAVQEEEESASAVILAEPEPEPESAQPPYGPTDPKCRKKKKSEATNDKLEQAMETFKWQTNFILESLVTSNWTLFISALMILQWHIRFFFHFHSWVYKLNRFCGGPPRRIWRRLGLDIWIVQFYYDPDMPTFLEDFVKKKKFVAVLLVIVIDNLVVFYVMKWLAGVIGNVSGSGEVPMSRRESHKKHAYEDDPTCNDDEDVSTGDDEDESELNGTAENMYMDLTLPFNKVVAIFVIQLLLFFLYVEHLNLDKDTHNVCKVQYAFWILALLVKLCQSEQQLGKPFNPLYWDKVDELAKVTEGTKGENVGLATHNIFYVFKISYKNEWKMRRVMDFIINSGCRYVIMYTFPILLCVEEPLDFVKDCTAVFFMTQMDDIEGGDSREMLEMMSRLKFNVLWGKVAANKYDLSSVEQEHRKEGPRLTSQEVVYISKDENKGKFQQQADYKDCNGKCLWDHLLSLTPEPAPKTPGP